MKLSCINKIHLFPDLIIFDQRRMNILKSSHIKTAGINTYMKQFGRSLLIIIVILSADQPAYCQENNRRIRIGFNYGSGSQQLFPFRSRDYNYSFTSYKLLCSYPINNGLISFEVQAEPSLFLSRHQLLNKYFVQPEYGPDYLFLREVYTKEKSIYEYSLNIGLQIRFKPGGRLSYFISGSTGPMFINTATERLARGFAFSDIFAFGIQYNLKNIIFELRPGIRHASNLDFQFPNSGLNATTLDFGISFLL